MKRSKRCQSFTASRVCFFWKLQWYVIRVSLKSAPRYIHVMRPGSVIQRLQWGGVESYALGSSVWYNLMDLSLSFAKLTNLPFLITYHIGKVEIILHVFFCKQLSCKPPSTFLQVPRSKTSDLFYETVMVLFVILELDISHLKKYYLYF